MTTCLATCSCGQVRLSCSGDPVLVGMCHCRACQKRTGSAFGLAAFYEQGDVHIEGETTRYTRPCDSGFDLHQQFCPVCGSTVYWFPERLPDRVAVAVGAFADPGFPAPDKSVYEETRAPWLQFDLG